MNKFEKFREKIRTMFVWYISIIVLISIIYFIYSPAAIARVPAPRDIPEGAIADAGALFGDRWEGYLAQQHMVEMRDGIRLNTYLLYPKDADRALPIILTRTPYGWRYKSFDGALKGDIGRDAASHTFLIDEQYIFVLQDERGMFGSEGKHELLRPFYSLEDPTATDEITDIYDTVEWALQTAPNHNGRVGLNGTSYRGWYAAVGLIRPHPAIKAAAPSAAMAEGFRGDDFYQNGAFNLSMTMPLLLEKMDLYEARPVWSDFVAQEDEYDFYLRHVSMEGLKQYFPKYPNITLDVLNNDRENEYWQKRRLPTFFDHEVIVPTLHIVGGYDSEDFHGPLKLYQAMERHDKKNQNMIVMGPWYHGAWRYGAEHFGPISFGTDTAKYFQDKLFLPFFRKHLKGANVNDLPNAHIFDTGKNSWRSFDTWPPKHTRQLKLFPLKSGHLSLDKPSSERDAQLSYSYDPDTPIPYYPRPNFKAFRADYKVQDQRFSMHRPDVLTFVSNTLKGDITIAGEAVANLHAATSATDTDWVVKVIDVYPNDDADLPGFHRLVFGGIFRAKFHTGLDRPKPVEPNAVLSYNFSLNEQLHTVKKGHRLMVQIQSSWFPLFDRNPNKFMRIHEATSADFSSAHQTIFMSRDKPSFVELTVLP
ncbi:MAG: CocE/NonD family hydrolase [Pseudomonadota bacterium]